MIGILKQSRDVCWEEWPNLLQKLVSFGVQKKEKVPKSACPSATYLISICRRLCLWTWPPCHHEVEGHRQHGQPHQNVQAAGAQLQQIERVVEVLAGHKVAEAFSREARVKFWSQRAFCTSDPSKNLYWYWVCDPQPSAKIFLGLKILRKIKENFFKKFQHFLDPKNFWHYWFLRQNV